MRPALSIVIENKFTAKGRRRDNEHRFSASGAECEQLSRSSLKKVSRRKDGAERTNTVFQLAAAKLISTELLRFERAETVIDLSIR
jgi:hypothetical protein